MLGGVEATIGHPKDSNDDQQQFTCAQNFEESNEDLRLSEQSDVSSDAPSPTATATSSINETFDSEMAHHVGPYASITQCSSDGEDNGVSPIAPSKHSVCGLQSELHSDCAASENVTPREDSLGEGFAGVGDNIFTEESHSTVTESEPIDSLGEGFAGGGDNILTEESHSTVTESEAIDSLGEEFAGGGDNILTEETHSTVTESEEMAGSIYLQANAVIDCNMEINVVTPIQNQMNTGAFSDGESSSDIDLKESDTDTPVEEVCVTGTQGEGSECVSETESLSIPMSDVGSEPHVKAQIVESTDATQPTSLCNAYNFQHKRAHSESSETMSKEICVRGRTAPSSTTTDEVLPSAGILMKSVPLQLTPGNATEGRDNLAGKIIICAHAYTYMYT